MYGKLLARGRISLCVWDLCVPEHLDLLVGFAVLLPCSSCCRILPHAAVCLLKKNQRKEQWWPSLSHVHTHATSWMPPKSFWWTVCFTLGWSQSLLLLLMSRRRKQKDRVGGMLCAQSISQGRFVWNVCGCGPHTILQQLKLDFQHCFGSILLKLNASWWELCGVRERINFNSPFWKCSAQVWNS